VAQLLSNTPSDTSPVIADGRGKPVELICQELQRLNALHPISVVLIDYLQCITTSTKTDDRRGQINHIARSLTDTIKGMGAAGVLASQLTGDDIRESRDVEHAAEVVLIGRKDNGRMSLFVKKNKSGPNDQEIELTWDSVTGSFATGDGYESMFD
jgi:replicative DNA helicase